MDEREGASSGSEVVVVIPAHNEERFIGSVVLEARAFCRTVLVVDDGSDDRTAAVAAAAGAVVVRLPQCMGKGRALNAGFERSRQFNPRVVVTLDGDAQHDPADIPRLAAPILAGDADVVVGSRFRDLRSEIPWWRVMGQWGLTVLTNAASGVKLSDSQSGYRAFSRRALDVLRFHSDGLAVESEMQFLLSASGLVLAEVGIRVQYADGAKRNPIRHGLSVVDAMLQLVARRHPLLFFGGPGVISAGAGLGVGLEVVSQVGHHLPVPLGTAIVSVLLLLAGLVLGVTATVLHSLERFADRLTQQLGELLAHGSSSGKEWSA
jgi:glycosyltransferase involved in cell wall biosynthesis